MTPDRSGRADRARVGRIARVDAERDDARGPDADDGVFEPLSEGLASRRDHGCGPAHLDHARLAVRTDSGYPAKPLPSEIFEFPIREHAHAPETIYSSGHRRLAATGVSAETSRTLRK